MTTDTTTHDLAHRFDGCARTQREPAEVEIRQAEKGDQLPHVPSEDPARVIFCFLRLCAQPMCTVVGHDDPKARRGNAVGMAEPDPIHLRVGKKAMQQDDRPALSDLMIGELNAVRGTPEMR